MLRTGHPPFGTEFSEIVRNQDQNKLDLSGLEPWEIRSLKMALSRYAADRPSGAVAWVAELRLAGNRAGKGVGVVTSSGGKVRFVDAVAEAIKRAEKREAVAREEAERKRGEAEEARREAEEQTFRRLKLELAGRIDRHEWTDAYDTVDAMLAIKPDNADALASRTFLLERCLPEQVYQEHVQNLRDLKLDYTSSKNESWPLFWTILGGISGAVLLCSLPDCYFSPQDRFLQDSPFLRVVFGFLCGGHIVPAFILCLTYKWQDWRRDRRLKLSTNRLPGYASPAAITRIFYDRLRREEPELSQFYTEVLSKLLPGPKLKMEAGGDDDAGSQRGSPIDRT